MPKLIARRLSSLPMRPIPITPSVLLYSSTPSKFFLSQCLLRTFASACAILRATESSNENACSAVEIVLPPGAFSTTTPRRVAVSTSTLSTPTPARPTTRNRVAAFKIAPVTFVWLRTTIALKSAMILTRSASLKPVFEETSSALSRESSSTPRCEIESAINTLGGFINLTVNDELDGVWQLLRDVGGHASSEKIGQGVPLGRADHEKVNAHRCRKIENGCGRVFTHGVNWQDANVALGPELQHKRHNSLCFRVILPPGTTEERWSASVVDRNFFDVKNAQSCFAQL